MKQMWLVERRLCQRLTQEQVARLAGIERSYYTKIENGAIPSVKVAKRIAHVLQCDWTRFFTDQPESSGFDTAAKSG